MYGGTREDFAGRNQYPIRLQVTTPDSPEVMAKWGILWHTVFLGLNAGNADCCIK